MSYDFTVFDSTGDTIVYNNTQFNVALEDLCDILLKDIDVIKNKRFTKQGLQQYPADAVSLFD